MGTNISIVKVKKSKFQHLAGTSMYKNHLTSTPPPHQMVSLDYMCQSVRWICLEKIQVKNGSLILKYVTFFHYSSFNLFIFQAMKCHVDHIILSYEKVCRFWEECECLYFCSVFDFGVNVEWNRNKNPNKTSREKEKSRENMHFNFVDVEYVGL